MSGGRPKDCSTRTFPYVLLIVKINSGKMPWSKSQNMTLRLQLFTVATAFYMLFAWIYVHQVQPINEYANFSFNADIQKVYYFPCLFLSLFILAILPNRDKVSTVFAIIIYVFVFSSILQVGVYFIDKSDRFNSLLSIFIGLIIIVTIPNFDIKLRFNGDKYFTHILYFVFGLSAFLLLREAAINGVKIVGFSDIYELRADLVLTSMGRYSASLYTFSIGPLMIAYALFMRKPLLVLIALFLYFLIYTFTFQKFTLLSPLWIFAIWYSSKFTVFRRPVGLMLIYITPFLLAAIWCSLNLPGSDQVRGLILVRLYSVPGQVFAHYVDFFSDNPHTYFSHVSGISWFVNYPYDQAIPLVIKEFYPGGNQNANFWAQDAVAGMGIWAIPAVSAIFGVVLTIANTASRGLDPRFAMTAVSLTAQRFTDGTLATGLFSGGLALTLVMLALAPRETFGRHVRQS